MAKLLRPDPLGSIDLLSAVLVYFTQSFMPPGIVHIPARILVINGLGTVIRSAILSPFMFVL